MPLICWVQRVFDATEYANLITRVNRAFKNIKEDASQDRNEKNEYRETVDLNVHANERLL